MKQLLQWVVTGWILTYPSIAFAAEWIAVATNSVGDQFFVDKNSIQRKGDAVWYWEYRRFSEPNNAFFEEPINQPVYGAVIQWSVDCRSQVQRLRQLAAYAQDRKAIQTFDYGDAGSLAQPRPGSSAHKVVEYVCNY
ncbi:hypothetical protein J5X98_00605 [Leptothermofonsia sichuanensis E412]|uniref:surface-adhesin E family protein n=1 Tax=Leptothermofonsia sichuanensis TaxID=2917832 RepID=UPI001CA6EB73|nr:surface-adhesin E family protein [Leptothermofonsia sichuanensis]QZZ21048.1 hypothetical protein J5X98_00605 [Leptothermofonsia sichuanensis E412]